jgi:hypothetical protein
MPAVEKSVRQSLALPPRMAKRVKALAVAQHTSANRVLVDLIEAGLESKSFSELVNRLALATDSRERKQLKQELARMTFGE